MPILAMLVCSGTWTLELAGFFCVLAVHHRNGLDATAPLHVYLV